MLHDRLLDYFVVVLQNAVDMVVACHETQQIGFLYLLQDGLW